MKPQVPIARIPPYPYCSRSDRAPPKPHSREDLALFDSTTDCVMDTTSTSKLIYDPVLPSLAGKWLYGNKCDMSHCTIICVVHVLRLSIWILQERELGLTRLGATVYDAVKLTKKSPEDAQKIVKEAKERGDVAKNSHSVSRLWWV